MLAGPTELIERFEARGGPDEDESVLASGDLVFGSPVLLRPISLRDGYGFEGHVRTMWERCGSEVPEALYRLAVSYLSNVSEIRRHDEAVWAPAGSVELDYELEVAALIDTPARAARGFPAKTPSGDAWAGSRGQVSVLSCPIVRGRAHNRPVGPDHDPKTRPSIMG